MKLFRTIALVVMVALASVLGLGPGRSEAADPAGDPGRPKRLAEAKSWGFQLQNLDVARLRAAPHDVLVLDYSKDGSHEQAFTTAEIAALKTKPDGTRRIVLSYLSIGEAETYRYYWDWKWGGTWYGRFAALFHAPRWLGPENTEWGENYAVRYWQDDWQKIILGDGAYLDRIIATGFDGVYLDKINSSIEPIAKDRPSARDDMRTFVRRIAERGRKQSPGFLVVPQNGEELLEDAAYVALVDGLGKEDLIFGAYKEKAGNPPRSIEERIALLAPLRKAGKPVLAIEYIDEPTQIWLSRQAMTRLGFVVTFQDRDLGRLRDGDFPQKTDNTERRSKRRRG